MSTKLNDNIKSYIKTLSQMSNSVILKTFTEVLGFEPTFGDLGDTMLFVFNLTLSEYDTGRFAGKFQKIKRAMNINITSFEDFIHFLNNFTQLWGSLHSKEDDLHQLEENLLDYTVSEFDFADYKN